MLFESSSWFDYLIKTVVKMIKIECAKQIVAAKIIAKN